ncbi:hypothetical protein T06_11349 [Trichinella sp. T6]|nr:hypothetical protein T06_11349 [Trichinella sp. T6]
MDEGLTEQGSRNVLSDRIIHCWFTWDLLTCY